MGDRNNKKAMGAVTESGGQGSGSRSRQRSHYLSTLLYFVNNHIIRKSLI